MTMNYKIGYCGLITCFGIIFLIHGAYGVKRQRHSISRALRQANGLRRALIGEPCNTDLDCFDTNAECNSKQCACREGYVDDNSPDRIGGKCKAEIGQSCQTSSDCHDYFADCVQSTCRCQVGKIFSNGRCLRVCGQIDIRNRVSDLKRLENCSVIEGHLHIVLIDYANAIDYDDYSFPDLVEITDYLMLYRVRGLKSLSKLFPNLAVIRGQNLKIGCALIVYEMPDMVDLGLVSLTSIPRGSVRIEKNSKLCYIETVDWDRIVTGVPMDDNVFKKNRDIKECVNRCPEGCQETMGPKDKTIPRCWSLEHCQKNLGCDHLNCGPNNFCNENGKNKHCCDNNCIGGCYGTKATQCIACRDVVDYSNPNMPRCADRCSAGQFEFKSRRCLSMSECLNFTFYRDEQPMYKLVIPSERKNPGKCVSDCGEGFRDDPTNTSRCIPCRGKCPKVCAPVYIDRVESAQNLKGCTQILGNLEIGIPHGSQIGKELDENLASIEEVTGSIRIHRSNPLISLHFFKNLTTIGGNTLFQDRYSLVVIDNLNLQELFLEEVAKNLKLKNGTVLFQFNRKLCFNKIVDFVKQIGHSDKVDKQNDISPDTNGDQMPCEVSELDVTILEVSPRVAIFVWTTFKTTDPRHIISYAINYKEAPTKNVSIYANRDACSDDGWKVQDVQPKKDDNGSFMNDIIAGLKPWTQYALYIETLTISRAREGAISKVVYFRTAADVPLSPTDLVIKAEHPNELHVTWGPPTKPNGNITHYEVYWQRRNLDPKEYELRDYCADPLSSSISIEEKEEEKEKEEEEKEEDGEMCQCKKSQKELEKEKNEREMEIFFQNALQNEVFMKRLDKPATTLSPEMMDRKREVRSVSSEARHEKQKYTYVPNGTKPLSLVQPSPSAGKVDPKNAEKAPLGKVGSEKNATETNMTKTVKELMEQENPYYKAVVYETLELIIPNLGYFEDYNVEVIACQERDPRDPDKAVLCSNKALGVARTLPESQADTINSSTVEVHLVTNKTNAVYIKWKDPPKPNGLILTYDIEYNKANINNVKPNTICLTYKVYRDVGKGGHEVDNLEPGNYTFRIRANSLANNGSWTEFFSFTIPDPEDDRVKTEVYVAAIVSGLIIVILITIGVVWFVAKKRFEKEAQTIFSTNPEYPLLVYEPDEWEVDRDKVELLKELGQGSFGMVYEGIVTGMVSGVESIRVAVKTINKESTDHERYMVLQEASIMKMFKCHHVVRLIGVVSKGQPALVLMELMPNGDLKNFLRQHRPDEEDNNGKMLPTLRQIMQIAGEIADGMAYLADKKYVHRDLAARNCMVGEDMTVKIGDFGMTRDIYETDYYRKGNRGLLPVRWMAPESLKDGVFTSMSDVWSYGVVLWEMATLAAQPYQGLANEEVLRYVISGKVMDTPERCPPKLYDLMVKCWRYRPKQRPTFKEIIEILLPDLDKKFKDVSYFFSEENAKYEESKLHSASNTYQPTEEEIEDIDDDDNHCPMNDYVDEANLPMLGVGASNGHSVELQDIFTDTGTYPHYNASHKHVGSAESCDCTAYRETDEGAAAPSIDFNRQSVCSSPNSAIGGSSDGSKDSSKSSSSSYQRMNGLSVANGHVPVPLRTTPC